MKVIATVPWEHHHGVVGHPCDVALEAYRQGEGSRVSQGVMLASILTVLIAVESWSLDSMNSSREALPRIPSSVSSSSS
jgi:hypothetical protein